MSKATDRMRRHLKELIQEEVESFNGWSLNEESEDAAYSRVAEKVIEYLAPQIDVQQAILDTVQEKVARERKNWEAIYTEGDD